jgi:hypothetical protein
MEQQQHFSGNGKQHGLGSCRKRRHSNHYRNHSGRQQNGKLYDYGSNDMELRVA